MTTPTTTTPTTPRPRPVLSAPDIGAAAKATGALLDRLLDEADLSFPEWTVLFTLAGRGPLVRSELVRQQAFGLKVPEATAQATVDGMLAAGLLAADGDDEDEDDPHLAPTAAGTEVYRPIRATVDEIADRIYGDLPADDKAVTRRTLDEITRRANALLADPTAGSTGG